MTTERLISEFGTTPSTCQYVYYRDDETSMDSKGFLELWKVLGDHFGNINGEGNFDPSDITTTQVKLTLGQPDEIERFEKDGKIIGGAFMGPAGIKLGVGYTPAFPTWGGLDIETEPRSEIMFCTGNNDSESITNEASVLREHFRIADRYCPEYGFVDVSPSHLTQGGYIFNGGLSEDMPLHYLVEQSRWVQRNKVESKVRGLYWGNYLPNSILERLGSSFLDSYRKHAVNALGNTAHVWEYTNGACVTINMNPVDDCPTADLTTISNVNWLIGEFTKHSII